MTKKGYFGQYGGQFVPETLMTPLKELEEAYEQVKQDPTFYEELNEYLKHYVGRDTPLYYAERLSKASGGAKIYLKREDLNHTGAHKINHCIGEALLAKHLNKHKIIAETGVKIDIEDDGSVSVCSNDSQMIKRATLLIEGIAKDIEVGGLDQVFSALKK